MSGRKQDPSRVVFDATPEQLAEIAKLMDDFGEPTRAGLLRKGLRYLHLVSEVRAAGSKLFIRRKNGTEVEVLVLT